MPDFYDLNINYNYNEDDIEYLERHKHKAIALNITRTEVSQITPIKKTTIKTHHYSRITFNYSAQLSNSTIKKHQKFDIIAIKVFESSQLKSAIEMLPDILCFDLSKGLRFKHGFIRDAIHRGMYLEISTDLCLEPESRMVWLTSVDELLRISKGRNTIVTSAAKGFGELKMADDIVKMLEVFVSKKRAFQMVFENPKQLLRKCALKRHSYRGLVVNNVENGDLKKDFILNYN